MQFLFFDVFCKSIFRKKWRYSLFVRIILKNICKFFVFPFCPQKRVGDFPSEEIKARSADLKRRRRAISSLHGLNVSKQNKKLDIRLNFVTEVRKCGTYFGLPDTACRRPFEVPECLPCKLRVPLTPKKSGTTVASRHYSMRRNIMCPISSNQWFHGSNWSHGLVADAIHVRLAWPLQASQQLMPPSCAIWVCTAPTFFCYAAESAALCQWN